MRCSRVARGDPAVSYDLDLSRNSEYQVDLSVMEALLRKYRQGSFAHCARGMVGKVPGLERIPVDLSPGDTIRARVLLVELSIPDYS